MMILCSLCLAEIDQRKWRKIALRGNPHGVWCNKCRVRVDPTIICESDPKVEAELKKEMYDKMFENRKFWERKEREE